MAGIGAGCGGCGADDGLFHELVEIPAGLFQYGDTVLDGDAEDEFKLQHLQTLELPAYFIDRTPFPYQVGLRPATGSNWYEAMLWCRLLGKRLCTEEEWEKACKGPGNLRFPYGNSYRESACCTNQPLNANRRIAPIGSYPECVSGYGVWDMSGNINEWTASIRAERRNLDFPQPPGSHAGFPMLRGSDQGDGDAWAACSHRHHSHSRNMRWDDDGFRCCRSGEGGARIEIDQDVLEPLLVDAARASSALNLEAMVRSVEAILERAPDQPELHLLLAIVHHELHDFARARVHTAIAANARPRDPIALYLHGISLHETGDVDDAAHVLHRAHELDPSDLDLAIFLSRVLLDLSCPADAAALLAQVLATNPGYPPALGPFARALVESGAEAEGTAIALELWEARIDPIFGHLAARTLALAVLDEGTRQALRELLADPWSPSPLTGIDGPLGETARFFAVCGLTREERAVFLHFVAQHYSALARDDPDLPNAPATELIRGALAVDPDFQPL